MIVEGTYTFGDKAPEHLMGWAGIEWERRAQEQLAEAGLMVIASYADYLRDALGRLVVGAEELPPRYIWEYAKEVNGGQHLETWYQQTGDCVSMGCAQATDYRSAFEIAYLREEEKFRRAFPPWIYSVSRMASDLGKGQLGRSAGSTGAWGAGALAKYGVLFKDDQGVPAYSGKLADEWGRKIPEQFKTVAADNKMGSTAVLASVDQIKNELLHMRPVTIASMRGFRMQPEKVSVGGVDYAVGKPEGQWAHQMLWISATEDNGGMFFRLNSWGADAHGAPLGGTPAGGFWNRMDDVAAELRSGDCEAYAMSLFAGEPAEPDGMA